MTETFNWRVRVDLLTALLSTVFGFQSMSAIAQTKSDSQAANDEEEEYQLTIPRTGMTAALHEFSNQTGLNVGWFPESEEQEQRLVGPLEGKFKAHAALVTLLKGTEFEFEWLNKRSLYIFVPERDETETEIDETETPTSRPGRSLRRPAESGAIIVIASRINIDAPLPSSISLNRTTIESHGVSTLAELFKYLPSIPYVRSADSRLTGEQYADLRGLGAGTTLFLINGRRVGSSATSFDSSGFDTNTLPLSAVKRVEVFLDPSIAHGSDALGGVINIVLQDDIPRPIVRATVGSAQGGAEEGRASIGFGLSRDRLRASATLDFFHREFLYGAERDLTKNQDFRRFGRSDMRSLDSSPPNITSLTGRNLPGLNSRYAAVPHNGDNLTAADFQATDGQRNLVSSNAWRSIVPKSTRMSAVGSAELNLSDDVRLFSEFLGIERQHEFQIGPPTLRNLVVPASNPWNPFGEAVMVNAMLEGIGSTRYLTDATLLRGALGVDATLDEWLVTASALVHEEDSHLWRENELDPIKVTQALNATQADNALNVFRNGLAGSTALLESLLAARHVDSYESESVQGQLMSEGPIADLTAGKVQLRLGGEWQQAAISTPVMDSRHRTTWAAFSELRMPFIAPEMKFPAVHAMDTSLGIRIDYGNAGRKTNVSAQYAINWSPSSSVTVRASYRDFWRAPNLFDLYQPRFSTPPVQFPDPRRGNQIGTFIVVAGGNSELTPSSGRASSLRLEVEPIESTKLSLGYWRSVVLNRITYQLTPFILNHELQYPGRVVRAAPTLRDLELGIPGTLQSVDVSPGNYGELNADGIDFSFEGSWTTNFGRISPSVAANWNHSFRTIAAPGFKPEQRVAVASDSGTIPRWRAVASTGWERGAWSLFSALRFTGKYDDAFTGLKNGRSVPASFQLDLQASAQLDVLTDYALLQGIRASVGATNLLDEKPSYSEVFGPLGYDYTQADMRQRFWYLAVEKAF